MNENISEYLFTYMKNPDPRYAVMLKGKWGCGKSFFITDWLKAYKQQFASDQFVLEPIYVSLYGLKETSQITAAIDKVLHPILHSKGVEFTKKLFKFAGKIAFKTSLDWDKDNNEDVAFESTLDSLSIFSSKDDSVITSKLIIFDDLERSLVDMKLLLGYINNFVEHGACHVILVGDETHVTEESKKTLLEFKEKTVGRELEVLPDNMAAIKFFLNDDLPLVDWLKDKDDYINEIFSATQCDNLRLLRQCLYDFSVLSSEVNSSITDENEWFMRSLLATYVVCYCEYRGESHDLLEDWKCNYFGGLVGNKQLQSSISKLQNKYGTFSVKYKYEVLNEKHIPYIISEIKTGLSIKDYVEGILNQIMRDTPTQDKLACFYNMQATDFIVECNKLVEAIITGQRLSMFVLGRSLALLAFFDDNKLFWMTQATVSLAKKIVSEKFCAQTNKEDLYKIRDEFQQGVCSFGVFQETSVGMDIMDFSNKCFDKHERLIKNNMEVVLCTLNDSNVANLSQLSKETTPDHQCSYNMTSIFKNIDAEVVSSSLLKLKNSSIMIFCQFLSQHYMFSFSLGDGYNRFQEDLTCLTKLKTSISPECNLRTSVDGYVLNKLVNYLDGAIKRASGDKNPIYV